MSFDYLYFNDDEKLKVLKEFSQGNTFSLFKAVFASFDSKNSLLKDDDFILGLLQNLDENGKSEFLDYFVERRYKLNHDYRADEKLFQKIQKFWNEPVPNPMPFLMAAIPFLSDENCEKIINQWEWWSTRDNPGFKEMIHNMIVTFFDKGYEKSILALKSDYSCSNQIKLDESEKEINPETNNPFTLGELLFNKVLDNPNLLQAYSALTYYGKSFHTQEWLMKHLEKEPIDKEKIKAFFSSNLLNYEQDEQEKLISLTLHKTKDMELLTHALSLIGCQNIYDYKPKFCPVWKEIASHQDPKIYKRFLRFGIKMFDYYEEENITFFHHFVGSLNSYNFSGELKKQKIKEQALIEGLFKKYTDKDGNKENFFTIVSTNLTSNSNVSKVLNINLEKLDNLGFVDRKLKDSQYKDLGNEQKLMVVEQVLEKSFFKPIFQTKNDDYYNKDRIKKEITLNLYINNLSSYSNEDIWIVSEHLKLLESISPEKDKLHDHRKIYFKVLEHMFDSWFMRYLETSSKIYPTFIKLIDYVATDKSLDWKGLEGKLSQQLEKINKYGSPLQEGGKNIYNYLQHLCLQYNLPSEPTLEKKKIKI